MNPKIGPSTRPLATPRRMPRKAIFLDRDGTLIVDKVYLNDPEQIVYLPGVFDALTQFRDAGYALVIVTNQSGVPRGLVSIDNLNEIHRRIEAEFARNGIRFAGIYHAPYSVESDHPMRKPNTGMLEAAAKEHHLDLEKSWIIGDRMSDVEAGHRVGLRSILLAGVERPEESKFKPPTAFVPDLLAAARFILSSP